MREKKLGGVLLAAAVAAAGLWGLTCLLVPKYTGRVVEGNFTAEYYREESPHDVLILGDCEAYENISPVTLWREYGITSYIRGNAQQLMSQSYYLLRDALREEKPETVILSISAMQQAEQSNETYNRMTLDGMRWSREKLEAILASRMEGEHLIEYVFPLLRFHSRWAELGGEDLTWFADRPLVTHSGYYMRADVRPAGTFPAERRRSNYEFEEKAYEYLDRIRELCEEEGIALILFKAPSLYPVWYDQWDMQIEEYAKAYGLAYLNALEEIDAIGIDFSEDTYDGGLHMNVYGAEKVSRWLGPVLQKQFDVPDRRGDAALSAVWEAKAARYDAEKQSQEEEFARLGYLTRFSGGETGASD